MDDFDVICRRCSVKVSKIAWHGVIGKASELTACQREERGATNSQRCGGLLQDPHTFPFFLMALIMYQVQFICCFSSLLCLSFQPQPHPQTGAMLRVSKTRLGDRRELGIGGWWEREGVKVGSWVARIYVFIYNSNLCIYRCVFTKTGRAQRRVREKQWAVRREKLRIMFVTC